MKKWSNEKKKQSLDGFRKYVEKNYGPAKIKSFRFNTLGVVIFTLLSLWCLWGFMIVLFILARRP